MFLCLFSMLKITLACDVIWNKAVVHKDRIVKDSLGSKGINEIIPLIGHRNQVWIKFYFKCNYNTIEISDELHLFYRV